MQLKAKVYFANNIIGWWWKSSASTKNSVKGSKGRLRYTSDLNIWLCGRESDLSVMGVRVGFAIFFLSQSIGVYETHTF